jgi:predicted Zn-dependent peptidase
MRTNVNQPQPRRPEAAALSNGMRVVLAPCEAESVAFGLFVASGSRHESAKTAGISHFIEHMLFKGTPTRRPVDISRAIEGRGGNFNACTGEESTCFFAHLPSEYLSDAVSVISDMYLNATIPDGEFEREKQVVLEEIKMYADDPDSVAAENLQRALFPRNQVGAPVAGGPDSLVPMRPADLRRYIRSHYTPDATVAVVVGSFDPEKALAVVERHLGSGAIRRRKSAAVATPVDFTVPPIVEMRAAKDVMQTQLAVGYRTFGSSDPRKYAATVMDAILGRGMSSRLFQEVREKRGLSYDIGSRMQLFSDAGMFTVSAGLDGAKAGLALKTIDRELDRIRTKKVPSAELARTKEFLVGNFRLSHEKTVSKLFFYGSTMLAFGRLVTTDEQVEAVRAVTAADVQAVANEILRPEARSVSWVVPK